MIYCFVSFRYDEPINKRKLRITEAGKLPAVIRSYSMIIIKVSGKQRGFRRQAKAQ
jgi:hypothetical protein